jgi:response regulator RpfG family c-di-GMP phosphodiesterase
MAVLEKVSTLGDMKNLMNELHRLEVKFLFDFYGVLQDFPSKKILPQWLQKKNINSVFISENGNDVVTKVNNSKRLSVIIYDIETPNFNGLQFLAALEKTPDLKSRCKIILATPRLSPDAKSKLLHLGVATLISKPLDGEELRIAFEKIGLDY